MVLACAEVASAGIIMIPLDAMGQGVGGNVGASYVPIDANGNPAPLLLTARSGIDGNDPFDLFALGSPGSIFIAREGVGVQGEFGGGSTEISGLGGFGDEELIIIFSSPVLANAIDLGFAKFDPGTGLFDRDDAIVFVTLTGGAVVVLDETDYMGAFSPTGRETGFIQFSVLSELRGAMVESIVVRETNKHMLVNFVVIPSPGVLAMLGVAGLLGRRRRRRLT